MTPLESEYLQRFQFALKPLATAIEAQLRGYLENEPRIDRISARPKSVDRFLRKAAKEVDSKPKYTEPLRQIQDQVGARIVTFYLSDVERVANFVERYYRPIETKQVVPDSESEFGYFGKHYIFLVPRGLLRPEVSAALLPEVFELQVKTLFQHAWSEADHDLGYKPDGKEPDSDQVRLMAFAAAQAWGADRVFEELFGSLAS